MKSTLGEGFIELFNRLPDDAKRQIRTAYKQFRDDPYYPGLHFKKVHPSEPVWSVRIGLHYRAVGVMENGEITWQWIGSHAEYDKFLSQF